MSDSTNTALSRRRFLRQATAGTAAAAAALTLTQTDALAISPAATSAAAPASLDCSLPSNVEALVQQLLLDITKLNAAAPDLPGFRSFEEFFDAEVPEYPSDEDAMLLIGAFYLKLLELARVPLYFPSNEQVSTWLEEELPVHVLGAGFFEVLLIQTKDQIKNDPRLIEVYHAAYYRVLATETEISIMGPKKPLAYRIGYALGAFVRGFIDGLSGK